MDIRTAQELDAAVSLQRLKTLAGLLTRATRRGLLWKGLQFVPLMFAPVLLVSFGSQQAAFNVGAAVLFLVLGLSNLLVADRVDALVEILEARGLLVQTPPPAGPAGPATGQVARGSQA